MDPYSPAHLLEVIINLIYCIMAKSTPGAFTLLKGKVGGVVYYKLTDSNNKATQGTRVYTSQVRNPNTTRQQYQRAILKTVSNMYAQGKVIFNHSFQGKSVGGANAREFRRLNMRALRAQCVADYDAGLRPAGYRSFVSAKGSMYAAPNEYIVSQGTYDQKFFTWNDAGKTFGTPELTTGQTVADYMANNGLIEGDIYTFVGLVVNKNVVAGGDGQTAFETNYKSDFFYTRLLVKPVADTTVAITDFSQIFHQLPSSFANIKLVNIVPGDDLGMTSVFAGDIPNLGAFGVIRSREDQDLRSNSTMHLITSTDLDAPGFGIISAFVDKYWADDAGNLGDSELLLEGGDANPTAGV